MRCRTCDHAWKLDGEALMNLILQGTAQLGDLSIEVDFSVGNEVVAITGVNGIGKTSLLKVIAGLVSL